MSTITCTQLDSIVERINTVTKSPKETYSKSKSGKYKSNPGNYHLDGAYGGWALYRICNVGGGVEDVLSLGHVSKRELYTNMHSFLRGITCRSK